MTELKIKGIKVNEITAIDKVKKGVYNLSRTNGQITEVEMTLLEYRAAIQRFRQYRKENKAAPQPNDKPEIEKKISAPIDFEKRIEMANKSFLDVEFVDPDLHPYWEAQDKIPWRLSVGYEFTKKSDLRNFDLQFADVNIGLESNPDGNIMRGDLTLMHIRTEVRNALIKHIYEKRPRVESSGFQQIN